MTKPFARGARLLLLIGAALLAPAASQAHGIAGDRVFPSTLIVEDPVNTDELALPTVARVNRAANGDTPAARDLDIVGEFSRLLTPDLAFVAGSGWRRRNLGTSSRNGWDNLDLGLKYLTFESDPHELLVSTALNYEIGGTGARGVGFETFHTIRPLVTFGKGLGDLPREVDWLRPAAISGAAGFAIPTGAAPKLVQFGITLQYSLLYLNEHIRPLAAPEWMTSLIPLVEFAVETPAGRTFGTKTTATAGPGVAWIGDGWQLAAEAIVPLNGRTGHGVGFIAQAHFFLDDLLPAVFGKPLF
jgi:hypothetical protein